MSDSNQNGQKLSEHLYAFKRNVQKHVTGNMINSQCLIEKFINFF